MTTATAVRERPILFSGPMVRAILGGRKSVTRRVIEKADIYRDVQPGDRLWVRETWCPLDRDGWWNTAEPADRMYDVGGRPRRNGVAYRAHADAESERCRVDLGYRWRPSIYMPRWASRILLEVTEETRVERIQEITTADCHAEGLPRREIPVRGMPFGDDLGTMDAARFDFRDSWDSLNATREGGRYSWDANPSVRRIAFRPLPSAPSSSTEDPSPRRRPQQRDERMSDELNRRIKAIERKLWPERFCQHEWRTGPIPCPDNRPDCLVAHYGTVCVVCGARP